MLAAPTELNEHQKRLLPIAEAIAHPTLLNGCPDNFSRVTRIRFFLCDHPEISIDEIEGYVEGSFPSKPTSSIKFDLFLAFLALGMTLRSPEQSYGWAKYIAQTMVIGALARAVDKYVDVSDVNETIIRYSIPFLLSNLSYITTVPETLDNYARDAMDSMGRGIYFAAPAMAFVARRGIKGTFDLVKGGAQKCFTRSAM